MGDKKYNIHFISNTHWDREWLYDFQETRMMLVEFFDSLLEILETMPEYRSFVLDSQVVPVEDYLEVRPENKTRIEAQVRSRRLLIGPWYTCPEGFEVNGESLVRNLLIGHHVAETLGHVMKVGHTPFSYGQNSQMPQIYRGFCIDTILFYHGVSHDEVSNEFIFEGADGTRILGSQMSSGARYNFYHGAYRPAVIGKTSAQREYEWCEGGIPFHRATPENALSHYRLLDPNRLLNRDRLSECVRRLRESEARIATTCHLMFMMGHDSSVADPLEPEMIKITQQTLVYDEVIHGQYEELMEAIKGEIDWEKLPVLRGERRVPKPMPVALHLYSDVLSSRTRMKYRCSEAEYLLQARTEPFAVAAAVMGAEYPRTLLTLAWKTLLKCHAHDSISGSGVDSIEEDVLNRLNQVIHIGEGICSRVLAHLQQQIDLSTISRDSIVVTVYNPTPRTRSEIVTAVIDLPWEGPRPRGQFCLRDAVTGEEVPVQCVSRKPHWAVINHAWDAPCMMRSERFTIHFEAKNIPGLGFACFYVDTKGAFMTGSMVTASNTLENEYIRARIENDGTLRLLDKQTGIEYSDMHYFIDDGEAGHAWMHVRPAYDCAVDSRGFPVSIALEEEGPLLTRFKITYDMKIPVGLDENGGDPWQRLDNVGNQASRSQQSKNLSITSWVTLHKGSKSLEIRTRFENTAQNHRLRVYFPTRRPGKTAYAESAFDVVERETVFRPESVWFGSSHVTFPMQRFVDVSDGTGGLAFICSGLREYEVTQDEERSIAVTLLRAYCVNLTTVSYRWEEHPEMNLSQSPGVHEFSYRLLPHPGNYVSGEVLLEAERATSPLEVVQSGVTKGSLAPRSGFLELQPKTLQMSACKEAQNGGGFVVRIYNPTPEIVEGTLHVPAKITKASRATLNEQPEASLPLIDGKVTVSIAPKKIMTLLLEI